MAIEIETKTVCGEGRRETEYETSRALQSVADIPKQCCCAIIEPMDDDPWSNGWSDPALNVDKEADISIPSWSTGSEIKWSEPSDIQGSLWSHSTDDDTWAEASSTYKGISLGPHPEIGTEDTGVSLPSPAHSEEPLENITTPKSPSPPPAHEPLDLPPSPDAFGSFETALDPTKMANIEDDDPWSASASVFPPNTDGVDQWGSAWTAPGVGAEALAQEEIPDEWEIAKQHKEKMDRQVVRFLLCHTPFFCSVLIYCLASRASCLYSAAMQAAF